MAFFRNTYSVFREELRSFRTNPLPLITAVIMPLAAWLILAITFSEGEIKDLPFAVVDKDNSALSHEITMTLEATKYLRTDIVTPDEDKAKQMLKDGEVFYIIFLPSGMEANVKRGRYSKIQVLSSGANLIYSKIGYKAIAQGLFNVSKNLQIERLMDLGLTPVQAENRATPIATELHAKGNPYFDYAPYLIPGMVFIIFQMSVSFSSMWIFRKKDMHSATIIIPPFGKKLSSLAGKLLALTLINYVPMMLIFTFIFPVAGVPAGEYYLYLYPLLFLYLLVGIGMGMLLSLAIPDLATATQILLVFNAMTFIFSGYTFPIWGMPGFLFPVTQIIPLTHFLNSYFEVFIYNRLSFVNLSPFMIMGGLLWLVNLLLLLVGHRLYKSSVQDNSQTVLQTNN